MPTVENGSVAIFVGMRFVANGAAIGHGIDQKYCRYLYSKIEEK